MSKKLYFLAPNEQAATEVVESLKTVVDDKHIYAVASDEVLMLRDSIPDADQIHKTDVLNAAKKGTSFGAASGLFAGLAAFLITPAGSVATAGFVVGTSVGGAALGALTSGLVGLSFPNSDLEDFEKAIEEGKVLMLVDIADYSEDAIKTAVLKSHPDAVIKSGVISLN